MSRYCPDVGCTGPNPVNTPQFTLHRARVWSLEELAPIAHCVATEMVLRGYSQGDTFAVRLALQEAVANAIKHGHRNHGEQPVQISYLVADEWVLLEVEDQGPGFDPSLVPDSRAEENQGKPSGRGLLLMRQYMTWVWFFGRGNIVAMCRQRSRR